MSSDITSQIVQVILDTSFEHLNPTTVQGARERIIDTIGCSIGGANAAGCQMLLGLLREWGGGQEATILAHGGKLPAHNAAMMNSIMARSYDFEPCGCRVADKTTPAHISGTTVPTALAVGEQMAVSGKELLAALILGDDLTARITAASNVNLDSGFEPTGTINMFGAAAIAGKLYNLTARQMTNAFGIVLNQLAGTFQNIFDGGLTFKLPQGLSARAGIFSAALARRGFTGVKEAFFSKYGYFSLYCRTCEPKYLTKELGKKFYANNTFKAYPCCRSTHAAIDCALELGQAKDISPEEIKEVVVEVAAIGHDFAVGRDFTIREVPQTDASFSLQYTVANALARKSMRLEHFTEDYIKNPAILDLISRIRLKATIPPETPLAAGVRVIMRNGEQYEKRVEVPKGNEMFSPLTTEEKREKFIHNVTFSGTVPLKHAEEALDMLEHLEEIDDIGSISAMLVTC
jgi:2-methylcitrate dehydratase PrpD